MQYYTFELDKEFQDLCVIIKPYGKYKYKLLPMGLKWAHDFVQQIMEQVLCGLDNVFAYLNVISIFSKTWEEHLLTLEKVLYCLEAHGFTINPLKCDWAIQDTGWLGYWLTSIGLKLWKKCISAILDQEPPCNLEGMCSSLVLSIHTSSCGLSRPIYPNLSMSILVKILLFNPWCTYNCKTHKNH